MVSPRQRLVLEKLANAGKQGHADSAFVARFLPELLNLVREQLATVEREISDQPFEFARVRITDKGRQTLEENASLSPSQGLAGAQHCEF